MTYLLTTASTAYLYYYMRSTCVYKSASEADNKAKKKIYTSGTSTRQLNTPATLTFAHGRIHPVPTHACTCITNPLPPRFASPYAQPCSAQSRGLAVLHRLGTYSSRKDPRKGPLFPCNYFVSNPCGLDRLYADNSTTQRSRRRYDDSFDGGGW